MLIRADRRCSLADQRRKPPLLHQLRREIPGTVFILSPSHSGERRWQIASLFLQVS
jgi:hypothetical protein